MKSKMQAIRLLNGYYGRWMPPRRLFKVLAKSNVDSTFDV